MKKGILFLLAFFISVFLCVAQKIITNPKCGIYSEAITITKIELTPDATILTFTAKVSGYNWIAIDKKSYIQPVGDTTKLLVTKAVGAEIGKRIFAEKGKNEISYQLYFPKLGSTVSKIDFGEMADNPWQIFDITIKEQPNLSKVPEKYLGNWISPDNGLWTFSLMDTLAILDSKVWKYKSINKTGRSLIILLKNENQEQQMVIKSDKEGFCQMGFSEKEFKDYTKDFSALTNFKRQDSKNFNLPVFNPGKVVYKGLIYGYTPRSKSTGLIKYMNQLTSQQETEVVKIEKDGSFNIELDLNYPQEISVGLPGLQERVFVEPGMNLFQLGNLRAPEYNSLFMGESADVNYGLRATKAIVPEQDELLSGISNMNQDEYINRVKKIKEEKKKILREFEDNQTICRKALQIRSLDLEYSIAQNMLLYNQNLRTANYLENKDLDKSLQKPYIPKNFDLGKLTDLKNTPINNDYSFVSSEYFPLLRTLKYTNFDQLQWNYAYLILELKDSLEKQKIETTDKEKEALAFAKSVLSAPYEESQEKKLYGDYGETINQFTQKHRKEYLRIVFSFYDRNVSSNLAKIFGVDIGLSLETSYLTDFLFKLNSSDFSLTDEDFKQIKNRIKIDYLKEVAIAEYYKNKARQEASSSPAPSVVKSPGDNIFDSIVTRFAGKVVFLDFWATWCSPCLQGIERMKPLKEELAGKDIVFVYITGPTSPEKTYNKMIPDIKGEHFRVNNEQWDYLSQKFKINGIPHYALVSKKGVIINPNMDHLNNEELKKILIEKLND